MSKTFKVSLHRNTARSNRVQLSVVRAVTRQTEVIAVASKAVVRANLAQLGHLVAEVAQRTRVSAF